MNEGARDRQDDGSDVAARRAAFLRREFKRHIDAYKRKQLLNKSVTATVRGLIITFGALMTILLGIKGYPTFSSYADRISIAALVISASVSALTAWESFSQHAWRWTRARILVGKLSRLRDELEYELIADTQANSEAIDSCYKRLLDVLESENDEWASSRAHAILNTSSHDKQH